MEGIAVGIDAAVTWLAETVVVGDSGASNRRRAGRIVAEAAAVDNQAGTGN